MLDPVDDEKLPVDAFVVVMPEVVVIDADVVSVAEDPAPPAPPLPVVVDPSRHPNSATPHVPPTTKQVSNRAMRPWDQQRSGECKAASRRRLEDRHAVAQVAAMKR